MAKKTTIIDVAREAGVSTATVSRVLNNRESVGGENERLVRAAVEKLGYRPQAFARAVRSGKSGQIGLIIPQLGLENFVQLMDGVLLEAAKKGYSVVTMSSEGSSRTEMERIRDMASLPIEGLICRPVSSYEVLEQARELLGIPVVGLFSAPEKPGTVPCAIENRENSAYQGLRYLLSIGRRRIACAIPFRETKISSMEQLEQMVRDGVNEIGVYRYRGYRRALEEAGMPIDPSLFLFYGYTEQEGRRAAEHMLGAGLCADALMAANDVAALGAMSVFREQGIHVPQQISVIGSDNSSICRAMTPTLTSIDYHCVETGRHAMWMLEALLKGEALPAVPAEMHAELVIRRSTCSPEKE